MSLMTTRSILGSAALFDVSGNVIYSVNIEDFRDELIESPPVAERIT